MQQQKTVFKILCHGKLQNVLEGETRLDADQTLVKCRFVFSHDLGMTEYWIQGVLWKGTKNALVPSSNTPCASLFLYSVSWCLVTSLGKMALAKPLLAQPLLAQYFTDCHCRYMQVSTKFLHTACRCHNPSWTEFENCDKIQYQFLICNNPIYHNCCAIFLFPFTDHWNVKMFPYEYKTIKIF